MKELVKISTKDKDDKVIAKDIAQLYDQFYDPIAECCLHKGAYMIALEIRGSRERRIVEIFVDKPGGISLDECGDLSNSIADMLEEVKAFPAAYRLDVSSPGVERPLQYIWQYERNIGRLLTVELAEGTSIKGRISAVDGETITLESPAKNGDKHGKSSTKQTKADKTQVSLSSREVPVFPMALLHSTIKRAVVELEF